MTDKVEVVRLDIKFVKMPKRQKCIDQKEVLCSVVWCTKEKSSHSKFRPNLSNVHQEPGQCLTREPVSEMIPNDNNE